MERHRGCGASSATEPEGQERPRAWWDPRPMGLGARTAEGVPGARRARRASLTFAGGEVVGAGHTRVTPQPCHTGPAAALPAARVAGCVQRAVRRAVAGWGDRKRVGVRRGAPARPASREDTYGHRRGSRGGRGCTPGRRRPCSRGGSDTARLPRRPRPGRPGGRSCRLQAAESGRGTRGCPLPRPGPSPSAHRGSRGSRGSRGGSGHSEGHQTQAGTGSGQPRRSPRAGSLRGCSHTLWSRGVRGLSRVGQPRPHARPRARGGLTHAGRGGSGSSQGHSGRTRSPRSLPGTCTGPSLGHSHRPPLQG